MHCFFFRFDTLKEEKGFSSPPEASTIGETVEVEMVEVVNMESNVGGKKVVEKIETVVEEIVEVQVEGLDELSKWLLEIEGEASSAPVMDFLPEMEQKLSFFKGYLARVVAEEEKLSGHQLELAAKMEESESSNIKQVSGNIQLVIEECLKVKALLEQTVGALGEGAEFLKQHESEVSGLQSWLKEVKVFLKAEEGHTSGSSDVETLKAQVQQSDALHEDIKTLTANLTSVEDSRSKIENETSSVSERLKNQVIRTVAELRQDWDKTVNQAIFLNGKLKEALRTKEETNLKKQEVFNWLKTVTVPASRGIETSRELQAAMQACEDILELCQKYKTYLDTLPTAERREIEEQLLDLSSTAKTRQTVLHNSFNYYETFKDLSGNENRWLSELEAKLDVWSKPAADAEEISAKLDELESFLRQHTTTEAQLEDVTDKLLQHGIMTVTVQNSQHTTQTRRKNLLGRSEAMQRQLEAASASAQECEQLYLTVLERITLLLQSVHTSEDV